MAFLFWRAFVWSVTALPLKLFMAAASSRYTSRLFMPRFASAAIKASTAFLIFVTPAPPYLAFNAARLLTVILSSTDHPNAPTMLPLTLLQRESYLIRIRGIGYLSCLDRRSSPGFVDIAETHYRGSLASVQAAPRNPPAYHTRLVGDMQ